MPLKNITTGMEYPFIISQAISLRDRLIGLLGIDNIDPKQCLHITPCSGIHTFGMKYPIDVLFLDENGYIIKSTSNLKANRVTKIIPSAKSILELPPGSIDEYSIHTNDQLQITIDEEFHANVQGFRTLFHWPLNIVIALLWSRFVQSSLSTWAENGGFLNFTILLHNTIILFLFLIRKKSLDTSYQIIDWLIPIITIFSAMFLRSGLSAINMLNMISLIIQIVGMVSIILSMISLGRSFGIVPAKREIKSYGTFKLVRHPLYASELIFYSGYFIGNPTVRNMIIIIIIIVGQIWRASREEKLLSKDQLYILYKSRVKYRFIPGIY